MRPGDASLGAGPEEIMIADVRCRFITAERPPELDAVDRIRLAIRSCPYADSLNEDASSKLARRNEPSGGISGSKARHHRLDRRAIHLNTRIKEAAVRYFFVIKNGALQSNDESGTPLRDDEEARNYALRIIRELKEAGGYDDGDWTIIAFAEGGRHVCGVPFSEVPAGNEHRRLS